MVKWLYGMLERPFGIGCQPKEGLIGVEPIIGRGCYDVISYDRSLTQEEKDHYNLVFIERREE